MAAAWMFTDATLQDQLQSWLNAHDADDPWIYVLYQNDYEPDDDTVLADMTPADFDGYDDVNIDPADYGAVAVVAHVAIATSTVDAVYTASPTASAQTIYGYYVTDSLGNLLWAESFSTPREILADDVFTLTPRLKHKTCRE